MVPSDNNVCWKPADNSTSFSQSESFALSTDYNVKYLISWFKDRAGNVSYDTTNIKRVDPNQPPVFGTGQDVVSYVQNFV